MEHPTETGPELRGAYAAAARHWLTSWKDAVSGKYIGADILSGLTVAAVALPLNLALAVACGLPSSAGLIAGAVGGAVAAVFGGSPLQVTGPAAALQVMVLVVAKDFGPVGVAAACVMVGIIQLALAGSLAGRAAKYVPEAVLAGFTTGVGLKLLDGQIPEVLGFDYRVVELAQMMHRPVWLHEVSWLAAVSGLGMAFLIVTMRRVPRFPAAIVGVAVVTFISVYLKWNIARVGEIPSRLPHPILPIVADDRWLDLAYAALPLGLLAAIESLLSAKAIDRLANAKKPHDPNLELFGQGLANIATGFMGGMPVSGVVVRSSVNVQSGGKTRLAALIHAVVLGIAILTLSTQLAQVPLAVLAGLLCVVGVRLIELKTLLELLRHEKIAALAFIATAAGTVTGHLMTGLIAGFVLHAIHSYVYRHQASETKQNAENRTRGIRAIVERERAEARRPSHYEQSPNGHPWVAHIRREGLQSKTSFVHENATVIGDVVLGDHVHIAAGTSVRADEGTPFFIGASSNIQDGVVIHALKEKRVLVGGEEWAVFVGKNVSIAHDALVHGPCFIGDNTFIGFKAVVHDSVVGKDCFIGIGAIVVGVEIPDGTHVPHGRIVDSADAVALLPQAQHAHREFNEDVVDVNRGLAAAYHAIRIQPAERHERDEERAALPAAWDEAWDGTFTREESQ